MVCSVAACHAFPRDFSSLLALISAAAPMSRAAKKNAKRRAKRRQADPTEEAAAANETPAVSAATDNSPTGLVCSVLANCRDKDLVRGLLGLVALSRVKAVRKSSSWSFVFLRRFPSSSTVMHEISVSI